MSKRHETIAIKQAIRYEWIQKTVNLLLSGLETKAIRDELHEFLAERRGNGSKGYRSGQTRTFVVSNLMKIWISPEEDLVSFRDDAVAIIRQRPAIALAVHWALVSAVYPFWFSVAKQTGRLLNLQDQVTQQQIINRLKEQYGDRQTVSRYARFVIRSFVAWGVLIDSEVKGCYVKAPSLAIQDEAIAIFMVESALLATSEGKGALGLLRNSPAFFPFQLPVITGELIAQRTKRINVVRYGLDDDLLNLDR